MNIDDFARDSTITIPEAGRVLGLGRAAAYAAAKRGEIPTLKFGSRLVVPVRKLQDMVGTRYQPKPLEDLGTSIKDQADIQSNRSPLTQYFVERIVKGDTPEQILAEVIEAINAVPGLLDQYRK